MNLHSIYRKKEDSVTRQIADETLLVPIRSRLADMQRIFALESQVAEYIWQQLDGKQNLEEIHRGITSEFEVENGQASSDLQEFISQLMEAGLIEEVT
ncbi:MAG: PqqD family peptide modification chaperone [Candidatus Aminicenantes bacterium]|nr:PqqD family peptide modification chaperone [Candidatus Aminicenantes bacterium]NIM84307.1 PqqD family peptide modification chaperone [Candidatus Aminicenantes bacterium]NIN23793.1 PqqD family peptide modification chaperone [Candidatus Aminicenantes bacterium]NIN47509.1 PqqD family peptide modification chaperone [Candidatus Aminicenantes bacterium]NIN90429.1 PqqD family peptide modification chaperone [Candidatus Aminicenantes bacterium]